MTIDRLFKIKSVLNTDGFDRRVFKEMYNQSRKLRLIGEAGLQKLPSYLHLLADIWAALYKNNPKLLSKDEIDLEVLPHRAIMEQVLTSTEFASLREYTRLDEVTSALGTVLLSEALHELIKENQSRENTNVMKQQQELFQKNRKPPNTDKSFEEELNPFKDQQSRRNSEQQVKINLSQAEQQEDNARAAAEAAAAALNKILSTKQATPNMDAKIQEVQKELRQDFAMISSMLGGLYYGQNIGPKTYSSPAAVINLAEQIKDNPKLRRIADLTGRLKKVAFKKQKLKTNANVERTSVASGNELSLLLPQELVLLAQEHKLGFLKKYAEGKLLQYSPKSKDFMGRGPVIVCLDTSGSMQDNEELASYKESEAKAVMLVLLAIAEKQKRSFALINFSTNSEVKIWEFPDPGRIQPETVGEIAEFSWGGGTDFKAPLEAALRIINSSKFKKGDIIFISDGRCSLNKAWLVDFQNIKQKKKFHVIGIQLGNKDGSFNSFADKVINTDSLMEQQIDIVFSI